MQGQTVITAKQARQITGGRAPLVPVQYEQAVSALAACLSLDDAKVWSDKADALAAWAKIYRNDDAGRKARMLKLHAFRRMGVLAAEIRPRVRNLDGTRARNAPGAKSILLQQGLSDANARDAAALGRMDEAVFKRAVDSPKPPSPSILVRLNTGDASEAWRVLRTAPGSLIFFDCFCRKQDAKSLARGLSENEAASARKMIQCAQDWLDEFEQYLPKAAK